MDDEQLRRLISCLSLLSNHGSFPLHTFSVLASAAPSDKLAEQLHQKWLSEESFASIAAIALLHVHNIGEIGDVALWSSCLAHLLSDHRSRHSLRKENRMMFRNSVKALLKMYPIFRQIDAVVSECLVSPMFVSLAMLMDEEADDKDIQTMAELMLEDGGLLAKLRARECDKLVMRARHCLCEKVLSVESRRQLLHVIDLWTYDWDPEMFPDCILKFYEKAENEKSDSEENVTNKKVNTAEQQQTNDQESVV
uniref:Uncharacterized protein n=1 Tax=Ascaris lumbricoides TaxID=6252 RepID=A0A9J2NZ25_ASCLU